MPFGVAVLDPWVGAVAGLRVVVAFQAAATAYFFRADIGRLMRDLVGASELANKTAALSILSAGATLWTIYGLYLIAEYGFVPADRVLWARLIVGIAYLLFNLGFTILLAGLTARASGRREGVRTYRRMLLITGGMMIAGAACL